MYPIAQYSPASQPELSPAKAHNLIAANDPFVWLSSLSTILQQRNNDDVTVERLICLAAELTQLENVSVALPESHGHFRPLCSSTGVSDGVYSFAVQQALCRLFDEGQWLVINRHSDQIDDFHFGKDQLSSQQRCLLIPIQIAQTTLAALVVDVRSLCPEQNSLTVLNLFACHIGQVLATQVVPNFKTLNARPYQRVQDHELADIEKAIEKCNGNKTMAARLLGMTPRQLRYRLMKLSAERSH